MLVFNLPTHKKIHLEFSYDGKGNEFFESQLKPQIQIQIQTQPQPQSEPPLYEVYKHMLNLEKSKLDLLSERQIKKYNNFVHQCSLSGLRGLDGIVVKEYNGEVVTNAWLKMYELMSFCEPMLNTIVKSKNNEFNTNHFAEAPGNFILAINHLLKTKYPTIYWKWKANSYRDTNINKTKQVIYLGDKYKIMKNYKDNWFYGVNRNGDITSPDNIREFSYKMNGANLVTSDVKYSPINMDFSEEEHINTKVQLGQTLCAINTLNKGGIAILKFLSLYEHVTVEIVAILTSLFKEVKIVKPQTSKENNSEIYLVCIGFTKIPKYNNDLLDYLDYINSKDCYPKLFDVDEQFLEKIDIFNDYITNRQINAMKNNLKLYKTSNTSTGESQWLETYQLAKLDPEYYLICKNE